MIHNDFVRCKKCDNQMPTDTAIVVDSGYFVSVDLTCQSCKTIWGSLTFKEDFKLIEEGDLSHPDTDKDQVNWLEKVSQDIYQEINAVGIIQAGFGAGPSFVGQKIDSFDPPISLQEGLTWLSRWHGTFKRARLIFANGMTLHFDPHGFTSVKFDD